MTTYKILGKDIERYQIELLKTCQNLHMACTGSGECASIYSYLYYRLIKARLNDWQPSHKPTYVGCLENPDDNFFDLYEGFDDIVKMLCKEAIRNYEVDLNRLTEQAAQEWVDKDPSVWDVVLK